MKCVVFSYKACYTIYVLKTKEVHDMYKTRNMELVVNDSILYVLKESGIHMGTSTCVAHN